MKNYLLVIDNGGTNTKVVLFDLMGKQIAKRSSPTVKINHSNNCKEVDMDQLWLTIAENIKQLLSENQIDADEIAGITTVGHGKGLYLINGEGKPIRNGILSADSRGEKIVSELTPFLEEIQTISFQPVLACQAPVLLKWIKDNEPENYQDIQGILSAKDYIRFCLTGKIFGEYTDISGNNLLNLKSRSYDKRLVQLFDIEEMWEKLPELKSSEEHCGEITQAAALATGLKEGTPVFGGMFDIDACAVATKVLDDSVISMIAGTWSINTFLSTKPEEPTAKMMNSLFVDKYHYLVESSSATSAGNLEEVLQLLLKKERENLIASNQSVYDVCEKYLAETDASTTAVIYLPFLYGTNIDSTVQASFLNIGSGTTNLEIVRAVYEGVVFSHKYHLEDLLKVKKSKTKSIRLSGGVVNSPEWMQLFADILDFPIEVVKANELGALGGAISTAVGLGLQPNLVTAAEQMTEIAQVIYPQSEETAIYHEKYKKYKAITQAMETFLPKE